MKKFLLLIIVLLLFPITVFAMTPNQEATLSVIKGISNVTVIDGVTIESTRVDDYNIYFMINGRERTIPYEFIDNELSFTGGFVLLDENNQVIGKPVDNAYAFFLYSILESKSGIPYDANNYYNHDTIKQIINNGFATEYKENSNTFGFSLEEEEPGRYRIKYHYYMDGDYPIMELVDDGTGNPATGNYNLLITIMLIAVLCLGVYSYVNRGKEKA